MSVIPAVGCPRRRPGDGGTTEVYLFNLLAAGRGEVDRLLRLLTRNQKKRRAGVNFLSIQSAVHILG